MHYNARKAEALDASRVWVEFEDGKCPASKAGKPTLL